MTVHELIKELERLKRRKRPVKVVVLQGTGEPVHVDIDHVSLGYRLGPDDVLLHLEEPK